MKKSENNNYSKLNRNYENVQKESRSINKNKIYKDVSIIWIYAVPATLALFCYLNGLTGDCVHDDVSAITRNPDVHGKTTIFHVFQNDFWGKPMHDNTSHKSYRPLTVLTFRVNYMFHGLETFYFHVVNVLLHVIVTTLFVYTCHAVLRLQDRCSSLAGILFAVHPIHTEAVSGIVGRAEVMAAAFYLLSFITYWKCMDHSTQKGRVVLFMSSLVLAAAAMLSKETGVTIVGVCMIYDIIETVNRRRTCRTGKQFRCFITRLVISTLFTAALLWFRLWIMSGSLPKFTPDDNPASFQDSVLTRLLTYGYLLVVNFWLLLAPVSLCYDWQHGSIPLVDTLLDHRNLATVLIISATTYILLSSLPYFKKDGSIRQIHVPGCMALVMTVIPFIPASNLFFTVGFVLAERVLYMPSMGFCLCISLGFFKLVDKSGRYRTHVTAAMLFLLMMLSGKTWRQNRVWRSREALFRSGIHVLPHNAKTHYNYANFLKDNTMYDEASSHYRESLRLNNDYASAHNNLGTILDDRFEAEIHFREALRLQPLHQGAHINLGNLLVKRGLNTEGMNHLYNAVAIDYRNPEALTSMARCLMDTGNYTNAANYLETAIEVNPEYYDAYLQYGALLSAMGRHEESASYYTRAYELNKSQNVALVQAAQSYKAIGNIQEAEHLLKTALEIKRDTNTLTHLAVLYYSAGRTRDSLAVYDDIEKLNDNSTETILRHAKVVAANGDLIKAEDILTRALVHKHSDIDIIQTQAKVKSNLQKYHEATVLLSRAIELMLGTGREVDLVDVYIDRGNNYKDMDMFDTAMLDFEAAIKINPRHVRGHGNCGAIYHLNGDIEKARYHYEKAIDIDPANNIVRDNLEKLDRMRLQRDTGAG